MAKHIILLGDGMSDEACTTLNNQTPLEAASIPCIDWFAQHGTVGLVHTVPDGLHPGSDVANMGILGYDPRLYYSGRGPIEAAAMGINVPNGSIIFRCNLVTIDNGTMKDFTAGHISNEESKQLLDELNTHFKNHPDIHFFPGVGYRNIVLLPERFKDLSTTAPHDILDQLAAPSFPQGVLQDEMVTFISECHTILMQSKVNQNRLANGQLPANYIWPWSQGPYPSMPAFKDQFGLSGGIITAVDLLKGLATLTGLIAPDIEGATGFVDTNYQNKMDAAFSILEDHDFCYIHIEAPDECGHMGDAVLKTKAIEDFDQHVCTPIKDYCQSHPDTTVLILPDHPTPCRLKTHTSAPVPFILYSPQHASSHTAPHYTEAHAQQTNVIVKSSWELTSLFLQKERPVSL